MKNTVAIIFSALCIICITNQVYSERILVVIPVPSYSHQVPFRPLCIELVKRGHEVVIIAADPIRDINATNFRQIIVGSSYATYKEISFVQRRLNHLSWLSLMEHKMLYLSLVFAENVLNNAEVRELYAHESEEKFDVILIEMFYTPSLFAFSHRFNAPVIGLSSLALPASEAYALGDVVFPSHDSTWETEANVGTDLPFWTRLKNFWTLWHWIYATYRDIQPRHQKLAEKYFGTQLPQITDLVRNTSLVFVNENSVMSYAHPGLSNIIRFHSIHVCENLKPLPQDLQSFVDNATNGFIYFSMGTNVRFLDLPEEIQQIFYDVFAKLPYKVVWKLEKQPLRKLDNVYSLSWFSQQSILAHRNIKLYMFQGGLQSTQEAIHYSVPLLGFPVLSDQEFQLKKIKSWSIGNRLYLETLTKDKLESTILEMISNEKYKQNIIKLRKLVEDTPYNLMDNLVWWTEYVIRNRGAPHLRTNLAWAPWYQYCDMDIVVFLTIVTFIVALIGLTLCVKFLRYIYKDVQKDFNFKKFS